MRIAILCLLVAVVAPMPAQAAYAQVAGTCISTDTVSDTSHTIDLSCAGGGSGTFGTIDAGDLLLVFFNGSSTDASHNTAATGWTICRDKRYGSDTGHTVVAYRIADGGEGSSVVFTTDLAERVAAVAFRITDWHGSSAPECSAGANDAGVLGTPDPDSLTPSWDASTEDTLWIVVGGIDANGDITGYPTDYGANQTTSANSGEGDMGVATREVHAASQDPGAFTVDTNNRWAGITVAVRPAAAGGGPPIGTRQLLGVGR